MSYRIELDIPGLPETVNQFYAMKLQKRMSRKRYWKDVVWKLVGKNRPISPLERARLTLIRCSATRPDPDGLTSSFKHIIDGLVASRVLRNDKYENIGFPRYDWEPAPLRSGRCKVIVEEVT